VGDEFQTDQVSYLTGVAAASGSETTTCGTCHSQTGGGAAHNWTTNPSSGGGFALDPAWLPYDNGRSQPDPQFATSLGQTCIDCHNYLQTGTSYHASPTNADGLAIGSGTDFDNYDVLGDGSHFLGVFTNQRTTWPALGQRFGFNAFADSWSSTNINGALPAPVATTS
jgi:cytochrome c553